MRLRGFHGVSKQYSRDSYPGSLASESMALSKDLRDHPDISIMAAVGMGEEEWDLEQQLGSETRS